MEPEKKENCYNGKNKRYSGYLWVYKIINV